MDIMDSFFFYLCTVWTPSMRVAGNGRCDTLWTKSSLSVEQDVALSGIPSVVDLPLRSTSLPFPACANTLTLN